MDATTLEANAALRAIVRRADGTGYEAWLRQVAQASGIETPTREDLVKLDRTRPRKGSNKAWVHPQDPESRITKMKDGRTHRAHKFEQAVDLDTGAVVAVQTTDCGDTASLPVQLLVQAAGSALSPNSSLFWYWCHFSPGILKPHFFHRLV